MKEIFKERLFWKIFVVLLLIIFLFPPYTLKDYDNTEITCVASPPSHSALNVVLLFLEIVIAFLISMVIILFRGKKTALTEVSKKCPKCAEEVKVDAQICRFCNYEFPPNTPPQTENLEERLENLRVKYNELAEKIYASKSSVEKETLEKERDEIQKEMVKLRREGNIY